MKRALTSFGTKGVATASGGECCCKQREANAITFRWKGETDLQATIRTGTDFAAGVLLNIAWCDSGISGLHSG